MLGSRRPESSYYVLHVVAEPIDIGQAFQYSAESVTITRVSGGVEYYWTSFPLVTNNAQIQSHVNTVMDQLDVFSDEFSHHSDRCADRPYLCSTEN